GNNTKRDKLAMTAPVTQTPVSQSEKIAMTAPVKLNQTTDMHYEVSFVMPQEYTLETLPKPNNDAVSFRLIPPREVAVILFSGKVSEEKVAKMTDSLKAWMDKKKLKANSQASLAQYSPPFIPAFLRKNEISFEIKDSPDR
ncbi:MAG: heme-binding protein, partial [Trueperaceae bacterium]|nr:heme-binding protein [Trueperaceae bacterium]